jgi:hypothetical protein
MLFKAASEQSSCEGEGEPEVVKRGGDCRPGRKGRRNLKEPLTVPEVAKNL